MADRTSSWFGAAAGMFAVAWGANQFVSLLVAYKLQRGVSAAVNDALFGVYALALIVTLLLCGPAADLVGRSRIVRPAVSVSLVASVLLMAGTHDVGLLFAGRFVAGIASGAIFAAGTAWVKELSAGDSGARRSALALSLGFGLGPLVTGVLGQWLPHPLVLAYLPHLVLGALALPLVLRVPETVAPGLAPARARYAARLRVRSAADPRFLRVVLPAAPWVFAAPSVAFAVLPSLVSAHVRGHAVVFSGAVAALTLGTGVAIQPLARRLDRPGRLGGLLLALAVTAVGMLVAALAAERGSIVLVLVAALPLGAGYGLGLVSGLLETQRIAAPGELGGLTGIYYALTYVGFALPLLLTALRPVASYPWLLVCVAVVAVLCAAAVRLGAGQPGTLRSELAAEVK